MGGTRFVGKALVSCLINSAHELTLFTRGRNPVPDGVEHIIGDRSSEEDLRPLKDRTFDVIVDSSGRNLEDSQKVVSFTGFPRHRFLYVSSAGVYNSSEQIPIDETSSIDPSSRHIGKARTEEWLSNQEIPFTSFRPTYIYGPGNYNPIERWFFDRIMHNQPVPVPGDGKTITQLGHVKDLADAMILSIDNDLAENKIYNCSSSKGVTFNGLVECAARACGKAPTSIQTCSFDPTGLDPKARKAFPLRLSHFFTDTNSIQKELSWSPKFDLYNGLLDSFKNDYLINPSLQPDFSKDLELIRA